MAAPTAIFTATYIGKSTSSGNIVFGTSYSIYQWDGEDFYLIINGLFAKINCSFFVTDAYYAAHTSDFEEPS